MKWSVYLGFLALGLTACSSVETPRHNEDVIAGSLASAVQLFAERAGGGRRAGSGVVLTMDGDGSALILTAGHLLVPKVEQSVYVHGPSGGQPIEATILVVDVERDIAILEARGLEASPVELKASARLGDNVWVVSFPWGRRGTLVNGFVSQIAGDQGSALLPIEGSVGLIDAAVSYGTSGGGVFDSGTGRLVGIVRGYRTAKLALPGVQAQSLEFPISGETTVIPTSDILCLLRSAKLDDRLSANETERPPMPGICASAQGNGHGAGKPDRARWGRPYFEGSTSVAIRWPFFSS